MGQKSLIRRKGLFFLELWLALLLWLPATLAQPSSPPVLVTAVDSIGMTVADMDRSVDFYSRVLAFEKVSDVELAGADYEKIYGVFGLRLRVVRMRLGGESIADVFRSVGGQIRESWCGPCFGQGPDALTKGERAITSFNRNWTNRMGVGGEGYLASPPVVAASALAGYMAPPSELGLEWDPVKYGV